MRDDEKSKHVLGFPQIGERVTSLNEHVLNACILIMRDEEIAFFARKESFVRVLSCKQRVIS